MFYVVIRKSLEVNRIQEDTEQEEIAAIVVYTSSSSSTTTPVKFEYLDQTTCIYVAKTQSLSDKILIELEAVYFFFASPSISKRQNNTAQERNASSYFQIILLLNYGNFCCRRTNWG